MPKVIGVHKLALKPGVAPEEFERAVEEILPAFNRIPGHEVRLLKGDRGDREGRYLITITLDSVERRDSYFPPSSGDVSEEYGRYLADLAPQMERFMSYLVSFPDPTFTDYVVVGGE